MILGILLTQLHTHIPLIVGIYYYFYFLIGIELAFTHFNRTWLSWKILIVPLAAFIGSCLAGFLNYSLLGHEFTLNEILALGQGYGWYSMSGILFTQLHSAELGGIALLTDLFRDSCNFTHVYNGLAVSTSSDFKCWRYLNGCNISNGKTVMWHTLCTTCHDERLTLKSTRSTFNYCVFKLLSN